MNRAIPIVLPATAWSARTEASSATAEGARRKRLLLDLGRNAEA